MTWIWVLIPLVAIIGAFIIEYQKNKMAMMDRSRQNEEEVEDLRKLVNALKGRIENLEAIAAGEPEDFSTGAGRGMEEIEIDDSSTVDKNEKEVSNLANKRRNQS